MTSTAVPGTEPVTTATLTVHAAGDEPLLDLDGAHVVSTVAPYKVDTTTPPPVLATAVSSTGWTVHAVDSPHGQADHAVLRSARALAVTSPHGDRQVVYVRGSEPGGPGNAQPLSWLNQQDVQVGPLFAVHPTDATVAPDAATDRAWRRAARIHALAASSHTSQYGVPPDKENPMVIRWAGFPSLDVAEPWQEAFKMGAPAMAEAYWRAGFTPEHGYDWYLAIHGDRHPERAATRAAEFINAGWSPQQAKQFQRLRMWTLPDAFYPDNLHAQWSEFARSGALSPDRVMLALQAGLSLDEVRAGPDWDAVAAMAALRADLLPAAA